jgi:hypothetical protein
LLASVALLLLQRLDCSSMFSIPLFCAFGGFGQLFLRFDHCTAFAIDFQERTLFRGA